MRILERKNFNAEGRTGTLIVDELPTDIQSGDVIEEVLPGLAFVNKLPPLNAETLPALIRSLEDEIRYLESISDWPSEL